MLEKDIETVLISQDRLQARVTELGRQITADYAGKEPIFVGILKGSLVFMADLIRAVDLPCRLDFMQVSSYGAGTKTSGVVRIVQDLSENIEGKDVIIVEDILDSGVTLSYLTKYFWGMHPASVRLITLLDKPERHKTDIKPDYLGFTVPDAFVVGYGLDYDQIYRNLPYIGILKPEIYS